MKVWRLANRDRTGLDGDGARLYGGRWNQPGTAVIYTASTLSLAVLEYLVHLNPDKIPDTLVVIAGEIPDTLPMVHIDLATLSPHWNALTLQPVTQQIGTQWVTTGNSAVLRVPSVVIPQESNYVLNPHHAQFVAITWSPPEPFSFDPRLLA
jgi:RES domain-containing protein